MRRPLGLLAVVPAFIALVVSFLWPSIWTIYASFTKGSILGSAGSASHNYGTGVLPDFGESLVTSLLIALVPLIAVLLVAPVIAWAASRAGKPVRLAVRVALALGMLTVAPVAVAIGWFVAGRFSIGGYLHAAWPVWLVTFGVSTALAATVYLSAGRPAGPVRPPGRSPALLVGAVGALAVLALSLQVFTVPVFNQSTKHTTLGVEARVLLNFGALGEGAALATLLGVLLGVLGLAATLILVLGGTRIEHTPEPPTREPGSTPARIGALAGVAVLLAVLGYALWPWLKLLLHGELSMPSPLPFGSVVPVVVRTWLLSLPPALVGCLLAGVAGFGIGGLRPLGRRSELLLLPFAPWLFVGLGPLLPHLVGAALAGGAHNRIPPIWLNIPVLVVVTLFFRGQHARRASQGVNQPAALGGDVVRLLPLLGALFVVTWIGFAQNTLWWYVSDVGDRPSAIRAALQASFQYGNAGRHTGVGAASPPPMLLLVLLGLVALQLFYFERLRISAGPMPIDPPEQPAAPPAFTFASSPSQPYPSQPYPGQPYPAQPYPAQPYPAQPYPAQSPVTRPPVAQQYQPQPEPPQQP